MNKTLVNFFNNIGFTSLAPYRTAGLGFPTTSSPFRPAGIKKDLKLKNVLKSTMTDVTSQPQGITIRPDAEGMEMERLQNNENDLALIQDKTHDSDRQPSSPNWVGEAEGDLKKRLKLPDLWTISEQFIKDHFFLRYCTDYHSFFIYENNIWRALNTKEVQSLILDWVKETYSGYRQFQPRKTEELIILLESFTKFSLPRAKLLVSSDGFLIPFKNGVLNSKTLRFYTHSSAHFTTHIIPVDYRTDDAHITNFEQTPFAKFLASICNNKAERLNMLRAFLYIIFVNNLYYQVALYIHGPGGTGKSTLINILLYLLGPEASISANLNTLTSRFGSSSLVNKLLVVFNDITFFKGKEPSKLKELISSDLIQSEKKYKDVTQFKPTAFVVLTSNTLWELKDNTTGISRRMVYFPFDNVPAIKNINLFNLNFKGEAEGVLVEHLPAFINWVLTCPQTYVELLSRGGDTLTSVLNYDNLINTHPLKVWASEWLTEDKYGKCQVGFAKSNTKTLYGNYLKWANENGAPIIKVNQFSSLLMDLLTTMGWKVSKKRVSAGAMFEGISIKSIPFSVPSLTYNIVAEEELIKDIGIFSPELDFKIQMPQFDHNLITVKPEQTSSPSAKKDPSLTEPASEDRI